jgi:hypothetical protein
LVEQVNKPVAVATVISVSTADRLYKYNFFKPPVAIEQGSKVIPERVTSQAIFIFFLKKGRCYPPPVII